MKKSTRDKKFKENIVAKKIKQQNDITKKINKNVQELLALYPAKEYLEREIDIPNIQEWKPENSKDIWIDSLEGGYSVLGEMPINWWKVACLAIFLCIIIGMVLFHYSDTFQNLLVACTQ